MNPGSTESEKWSVKESSLKRRDYLQQVPLRDTGLAPVGLASSGKVP